MAKQRVGKRGEEAAVAFLREKGYGIIATNYRCPLGEIDVVAQDGETLVFVEVKTRRGVTCGLPQESITRRKQEKLTHLAQWYMQEKGCHGNNCRFDVVAVLLHPQNMHIRSIELISDAF